MSHWNAIISGLCASFASMFGKLSGWEFKEFDDKLKYIVKLLCFCGMLFLNSLVWTFFVKALHKSKTSVEATAISSAANYMFSGILGYYVFQETLGPLWWCGIIFIILGITVINKQNTPTKPESYKS